MRRFRSLPVTIRIALTSAAVTLAILALFAVVVTVFATHQARSDFDHELEATGASVEEGLVQTTPEGPKAFNDPRAVRAATAGGGVIWMFLPRSRAVNGPISTPNAPTLGPEDRMGIHDYGGYRVVTLPIRSPGGIPVGSFQYGKPRERVDHTVGRIQLLAAIGLLGGTLLAFAAGLALARRALPPMPA